MHVGPLLRSSSFRIGVALLVLSLIISFVADRVVSSQAVYSPSNPDGGVAGLAMMFEILMLALRVAGIVYLLVGTGIWIRRSRGVSAQH
jgi:hypothetical protein